MQNDQEPLNDAKKAQRDAQWPQTNAKTTTRRRTMIKKEKHNNWKETHDNNDYKETQNDQQP